MICVLFALAGLAVGALAAWLFALYLTGEIWRGNG